MPIGTDGSMMFGITIIRFLTSSAKVFSSSSSLVISSAIALTSALIFSASSFWPFAIRPPISLDFLLRCARSSSQRVLAARYFASNSMTSSTIGIFSSWNFFLMFSFTASGLVRTNLISSIVSISPFTLYTCYSAVSFGSASCACSVCSSVALADWNSLLMFSSKPSSLLPSKRSSLYFVSISS